MSPHLQLIYCSRRNRTSELEAESEVRDILTVARAANPEHGITGALLSDADFFAQVLEGPADAVEELFARILVDPRHHDVARLLSEAIDERTFPDWVMGFTMPSAEAEMEHASSVLERAFLSANTPGSHAAAIALRELTKKCVNKAQVW
jgi:Sensors of blue-light using FAD